MIEDSHSSVYNVELLFFRLSSKRVGFDGSELVFRFTKLLESGLWSICLRGGILIGILGRDKVSRNVP